MVYVMSNNKKGTKSNNRAVEKSHEISASKSRRRALKNLLISGGVVTGGTLLPKTWTRPVVDSVILPSHAATTPDDSNSDSGANTAVNYFWAKYSQAGTHTDPGTDGRMFAERVLDALVPVANAFTTNLNTNETRYICVSITGNTFTARVVRLVGRHADYDNISGTVGVQMDLPTPVWPCSSPGTPLSTTMLVRSVTPGSCVCEIANTGTSEEITVLTGTCAIPDLEDQSFDCWD